VGEAVQLVKLGAFHYLSSNPQPEDIVETLENALEYRARLTPVRATEGWRKYLVGASPAMRGIVDTIRLVAARRCTVLITGETGTGKEMVARALHGAGNRSHLQLVAVNCAALPENLLEAELFGHVRGAFTGAVEKRIGRFEQANNSTLFLDEIADMPLDLQSKLLRVLQEREFQRLGSSESIRVDVRVIAATNVDLLDRVAQGKFREDLYYRLNVVPLEVPPLRARPGDIALLVHHFIEKICRQEEIPPKRVSRETIDRLSRYAWPGNVRQLENAVEMAIALSGDREMLLPGDFALPVHKPVASAPSTHISVPEHGIDFEEVVGSLERSLVEQALRRTNGNKKLAAELLRLKRTTFTAKIKSLEVRPTG
jgi:DNA-binding NtrC family response regulator